MPAHEPEKTLRDALASRYGRQLAQVVGLEPFEAIVATLLDRALDSRKRDAALDALREDGLLTPQNLAEADATELDESLRAVGVTVARNGLGPIRRVARWLVDIHHGAADELVGPESPVSTEQVRDELLSISGIGPATADNLLLFALNRPVYPVDRASYRVLVRHGWIDPDSGYDEARDAAERRAGESAGEMAEFSAWLDRLGRDHCRATVAKCDRCPLAPWLPANGPIDPGS